VTDETKETTHRIVVGSDGSARSVAALNWAASQATLTGPTLEAVQSREWPNTHGNDFYLPDDYDPATDADNMLDDAIEKVRGTHHDMTIRAVVVEKHPAPVLVEASRGADWLAVDSRVRGEFSGALLDSVSEYCTDHVSYPIKITRG
jgi:nucleotide-binding universal stress UspA family protein